MTVIVSEPSCCRSQRSRGQMSDLILAGGGRGRHSLVSATSRHQGLATLLSIITSWHPELSHSLSLSKSNAGDTELTIPPPLMTDAWSCSWGILSPSLMLSHGFKLKSQMASTYLLVVSNQWYIQFSMYSQICHKIA